MSECCQINYLSGQVRFINKYINNRNIEVKNLIPFGDCAKIGSEDNKFCEVWTEELFVNNETIHFSNGVDLKTDDDGNLITVVKSSGKEQIYYCATGANAIQTSLGGSNNIVISESSYSFDDTASRNVIVGDESGINISSGDDNTLLGYSAGNNLISGDCNVFLGSGADGSPTGTNQIAIGKGAETTASNQCVIGNSSLEVIQNTGDGTCDLGSSTNKFKDLHLSGDANVCGDIITPSNPPGTLISTGSTGMIRWDEYYLYVCVSNNIWKRASLSTFTNPDINIFPKLFGITYSPFRHDPFSCDEGRLDDIRLDLGMVKRHTNLIRTYDVNNCSKIGEYYLIASAEVGLEINLGVDVRGVAGATGPTGTNQTKIDELDRLLTDPDIPTDHIKYIVVGNETVFRGEFTPDEIAAYVDQVRALPSASGKLICTCDTLNGFTGAMVTASDVVMLNIHPFYANKNPETGLTFLKDKIEEKEIEFNKTVFVGESGWPSAGPSGSIGATASEEFAFDYLKNVNDDPDLTNYTYFQFFNGDWKSGGNGPYWGIYDSDRNFKYTSFL